MTPERDSTASPRVDVGVPVATRAQYISATLGSVLAQTFDDWRLTISEDGLGDDAIRKEVEPYLSDPRITHEVTGQRIGAPANMTRLTHAGYAPYIAILHDDDLWEPDFLARRVAFLDRHPDCGFVFSGHYDVDALGVPTGRQADLSFEEGSVSREEMVPRLLRRNFVVSTTMMIRRSPYEACGNEFDSSYPNIYDLDLLVRLCMAAPAGYLPVRDAAYRLHGDQVSAKFRFALESVRWHQKIDDWLAEAAPELRLPRRELARRNARAQLSAGMDALKEGDRSQARGLLRHTLRNYPIAVLDLRAAMLLAGLVAGRWGHRIGAAWTRLRDARFRRTRPHA